MSEIEKHKEQEEDSGDYTTFLLGLVFLITAVVAGIAVTPWIAFGLGIPAVALLAPWFNSYMKNRKSLPSGKSGESELLAAIRDNGGSITPAEAAMETSLTVKEADGMLSDLASGGHLAVESESGSLVYSLPKREKRELD